MSYNPRAGRNPQQTPASRPLLASGFITALALASLACGKVGAPVPPARITERTNQLAAIQRGNAVLLSWPAPPLGQQESSTSYIARADIYRLTERRDEDPVLDPDDYEELAELVGYLDRPMIEAQIKSNGELRYSDVLDLSQPGQVGNIRVRYAVRYANKRGQMASFSNTVALEPVAVVAAAPGRLRIEGQAQDAITIAWEAPAANVDGSQPASVVGYNVYRRRAKRETFGEQINRDAVAGQTYTDRNFQYQADYVYVVRALSQGADGLIESADSDSLSFTPVDTFKPSAPDPVSIASTNAVISLFWPTSPERDVIGYNVYRAESIDAKDNEWAKLNGEPLAPVTYRDDRVTLDKRYHYRVTAVDRFGNESDPSSVASETANP